MMKPSCERETLMLRVQQCAFAFYDAMLYLDTHPADNMAQMQAAEFHRQYCKAAELYNDKVGPLTASAACNGNGWTWVDCPWPWQLS